MIAVVWNTAASPKGCDVGDWLSARRGRIIVEYALPKSAWRVVVVEIEEMGPLHRQRTPPEIGVLNTENAADGIHFARWIFETCVKVPESPLWFRNGATRRAPIGLDRAADAAAVKFSRASTSH